MAKLNLNLFQVLAAGYAVLAAVAGLAAGAPVTFKLNNQWYKIQLVSGPDAVAPAPKAVVKAPRKPRAKKAS